MRGSLAQHCRRQHLPDNNDCENGDHWGKIDKSGSRHDLPDGRNDGIGDLDQYLRDRILSRAVEPGKDRTANNGKLHDQQERVNNLEEYQWISPTQSANRRLNGASDRAASTKMIAESDISCGQFAHRAREGSIHVRRGRICRR